MPISPELQRSSSPYLPRMNSQWTWVYAVTIALYAVMFSIGVVIFRWDTSIDVAVPALAIACWMSYVYWRHRDTGSHLGLLISALGWLAVAIAFLLRGSGPGLKVLRVMFALLGFVAILGGGIRAYRETRVLAVLPPAAEAASPTAEPSTEPTAPPDATPGGTG